MMWEGNAGIALSVWLFVLDGDWKGIWSDFIVYFVWDYVNFIENCFEGALNFILAVLTDRKFLCYLIFYMFFC